MQKRCTALLLVVILILSVSFGGCGVEEQSAAEPRDLRAAIDALSAEQIKDNSLDSYAMVQNVPLQVQVPDGVLEGGVGNLFLGVSRAFYFKKHLFDTAEKSWDELAYASASGETGSLRIDWGKLSWSDQAWGAGPVAGSDHYLTLNVEALGEDSYRYFLSEWEENGEKVREIPLDVLTEGAEGNDFTGVLSRISFYAMDAAGAIHLVWQKQEGVVYQILSSQGEVLAEYAPDGEMITELVPLSDGRVAFRCGKTLRHLEEKTGDAVTLASLDASSDATVYSCTLLEEDRLLYASSDGLYAGGMSGQEPQLLYLWSNHGINVRNVPFLQADGAESIRLVYEDAEGCHYLCLEPVTQEVEITEIDLAVSSLGEDQLKPLVVAFNKKYPSCHINIRSDYDETALLAEMTAGKGPVLVDTMLTGFEDQEKLWQPLDDVMDGLGLSQGLLPAVQEAGKINGVRYGFAPQFAFRTLLTAGRETQDWDYDAFIKCIEDQKNLEKLFSVWGEGYRPYFVISFFSHGVNDGCFWDSEAGTTDFDSEKFRKVLQIAQEYVPADRAREEEEEQEMLTDGRMLCQEYSVCKMHDLFSPYLNYGWNFCFAGYPTGGGAAHLAEVSNLLAIRRTASDKEKLAAYAFLDMCLSYEGQSAAAQDPNFMLSVREDVLKEQLDDAIRLAGEDVRLQGEIDPEKVEKILQDMLADSAPYTPLPRELSDILDEELSGYFNGTTTQEELIEHLESRVGLYFEERKSY